MGSNGRRSKFDSAFKSMDMQGRANNVVGAVDQSSARNHKGNNSSNIWVNDQGRRLSSGEEEKRRKRIEDKAELLLHLVCWGPK